MRPLHVIDAAAITSLGHDLFRTIASLRSGLSTFRELPFLGSSQRNLQASPVVGYAEGLEGVARYEALALRALVPLVTRIPAAERSHVKLVVGLPRPDRLGVPARLGASLLERLVRALSLDPRRVYSLEWGRPSVLAALGDAALMDDAVDHVIVGGVDVLTNPRSLRLLSEAGLLKEQWDGFIPSDAAAFVRVSHRPASAWGRPPACIAGVGVAEDPALGSAESPRIGVGLTAAFKAATHGAGLTDSSIDLRINDINGERTWFQDDTMACVRFFRSPRGDTPLETWHLGSHFGETGAAAGALEVIWATAALELGFGPQRCALLSCTEQTTRTAAVVLAPSQPPAPTLVTRIQVSRDRVAVHPSPVEEPIVVPDPGMRIAGVDDTARELAQLNLDGAATALLVRAAHLADPAAPWASIAGFESRLLAHVDALGWSITATRPLALERLRQGPDPEEAAAIALALGSTSIDDEATTLLEALISEHADAEDDVEAALVIEALALSPSTDARRVLERLAAPDAPAPRAQRALRALLLGGHLDAQHVTRLVEAERADLLPTLAEVSAAAGLRGVGPAIAQLHWRAAAAPTPADMLGYVALAAEGPLPVFSAAEYLAHAPLLAALHGLRTGVHVYPALRPHPELAVDQVRALGWAGETAAVPELLELLAVAGDELALATAGALHLILGAELYESVELEEPADEEPADAEEPAPRAEPIALERFVLDPEPWRRAYQELAAAGVKRMRHGRPWTPRSALDHLQRPRPGCAERTLASWEYVIVTAQPLPLHPRQLVAVQRAQLGALLRAGSPH